MCTISLECFPLYNESVISRDNLSTSAIPSTEHANV